jgi:4-aminobutyrate aminotransferase-like enzyme
MNPMTRLNDIESLLVKMSTQIFTEIESNVHSYCQTFPVVFTKAKEAILYAESGEHYIDFFAGAGVLNYGHNNDYFKQKLIEYVSADFITHGLELYTSAKREFLIDFNKYILKPRKLLPPLIINQKLLAKGCQILKQALIETLESYLVT